MLVFISDKDKVQCNPEIMLESFQANVGQCLDRLTNGIDRKKAK